MLLINRQQTSIFHYQLRFCHFTFTTSFSVLLAERDNEKISVLYSDLKVFQAFIWIHAYLFNIKKLERT